MSTIDSEDIEMTESRPGKQRIMCTFIYGTTQIKQILRKANILRAKFLPIDAYSRRRVLSPTATERHHLLDEGDSRWLEESD